MKYAAWILLFVFCLAYPAAAQVATPSALPRLEFSTQTDPVSLLGAFYNAISLGDYARAYAYWEQAPRGMTEAQFAAGFGDTRDAHVLVRLPIAADAGAGNVYASIAVLVIAEHTDDTTHYYAGCFTAHLTNVPVGNATEPDPNWHIQAGTLREQATPDLSALDTACELSYTLVDDPYPQSQLEPTALVQAYFAAVAGHDTMLAASYWETPSQDLFAQQYGSTAASAQGIGLIVNPETFGEGAAGSVYVSVPTLTVFTLADDSAHYVTGCYVTRAVNVPVGDAATPDPNWHFYGVTLSEVPDVTSAVLATARGCN
ncbi:MAG: hypothetical protein U0694_06615 [Anaerolineae bacterium]